ncbi:DUF4199 family protein [Niabella hibiscisoli]|uniref:DUF4199 family protein n=1 Tax=Niabella hibiscisoli TaxID=1825928 RepID=UPI001F0E844C|nr:DUF4199 family protein [Niabella hibiscisoli]MCH5720870.1 DUF4199 family protein [Niabella hibiscisoli]
MKLTSTIKGLITGLLMVGITLALTDDSGGELSAIKFVAVAIYGIGIVWSIVSFGLKNKTGGFKDYFNQGFRCFVMATLVLAIYCFVFWKINPVLMEQNIQATKAERIKTAKDRTMAEIEQEAVQTRKYYIPFQVSGVVFSNLLVGVMVTFATSGLLYLRNKNS